jgi:antagonist of KipI
MAASPRLEPVGDTALAIDLPGAGNLAEDTVRVKTVAEGLAAAAIPGVTDVVPSPGRVTVVYDIVLADSFEALVAAVAERATAVLRRVPPSQKKPEPLHEIPVAYGGEPGPDLEGLCRERGLSRAEAIRLHSLAEYRVTAVGFTPGFAYLGGLSPRLAVPRRATPRLRVPAGSVGIGGEQTGVYPFASPGGWQLIGRTGRRLFDPTRKRPCLLAVGDRVRFVESATVDGVADAAGETLIPQVAECPGGCLTVESVGPLATVQDLGRAGYRSAGVPSGGAADAAAAMIANLAVGNPAEAAVIEWTLAGPVIRCDRDVTVALCGSDELPCGRPLAVPAGQRLVVGRAAGCRGYLAIAGGIDLPRVLGSRGTCLPASFGGVAGRPLAAGDRLPLGLTTARLGAGRWWVDPELTALPGRLCRLRYLPTRGMPAVAGEYRVSPQSDRMGLRLEGPPCATSRQARSVAVLPGTLQLPPDGRPILLGCDALTIGGYPVLGQVIEVDLRLAAQLRPGAAVRFEPTSLDEAHRLRHRQAADMAKLAEALAEKCEN